MLAGIRDILIITTPADQASFYQLLGTGEDFGIRLSYASQPKPEGLAQAFMVGRDFIGADRVALALGDNTFAVPDCRRCCRAAPSGNRARRSRLSVKDPERYGVVELDAVGEPSGSRGETRASGSPYTVTGPISTTTRWSRLPRASGPPSEAGSKSPT